MTAAEFLSATDAFYALTILIAWICWTLAVGVLADRRGRSATTWVLLSLCISPLLAMVLLLVGTDLRAKAETAKRDAMMLAMAHQQHQTNRQGAALAQQLRGEPPPPPVHRGILNIRIARDGQEIGQWKLPEIHRKLDVGELSWDDYYFDPMANAWLELVCHRSLQPA